MRFVLMLAGTFAAGASALGLQRLLGAPYWVYFLICALAGVILFLASAAISQGFIERRGSFDTEGVLPNVQAWELTAGTGVVPKWVSLMGLIGACFVLAIPFELLASLLR